MSNEFDDDLALLELNRKFAHVQLEPNESNEATSSTHIEQQDLNVLASWLISKQNVLYALCSLRRYLAKDITEERIQHVLDLNILNILIEHLNDAINANITYEIAWILTNLAYGTTEQTNILISSGAVQSLVQCFYTLENIKIQSQLAWAIANISIDAPSYREQLANNNFINDLSKVLLLKLSNINPLLISQHEDTEVATLMPGEDYDQIKNLTWSLGTLCRGGFKTSEHWEQYLTAFYALREVVYLDNSPIWMEACWGLARILSNNYQNAPFFNHLDSQHALCTRLVTMLRAKSEKEVLPILQTLCNFSTGPDTLLHTLLEADLLNSLWWFCSPDIPFRLRRNAILTISNLAADLPGVIEKIVDNENVMRTLLYHLCVPGHEYQGTRWVMGEDLRPGTFKEEWKVIREVLYALMNIMTYGLDDCISTLLDTYKIINPSLVHILHYHFVDLKVAIQILDLLMLIIRRTYPLTTKDHYNPYISEMVGEGIMMAMSFHYHTFMNSLLADKINELRHTIQCNGSNLVYGNQATGPSARRIVQGNEDGDIRFIEDAIHSMTL